MKNSASYVTFGLFVCSLTSVATEIPRALPTDQLPEDVRLGELRTLNDYFPFTAVDSPEAWTARAEQLRRGVLVATGLWPMPTRTPLKAVVHGKVDRKDYTVEKVFFQSYPGHYVTGNLYHPMNAERGMRNAEWQKNRKIPHSEFRNPHSKLPAVLCPHGHWKNGRFFDHGSKSVRSQIAMGAERFEVGGRSPLQARCVQLARMGCVVFHYDMIGYADSIQFLEHRPGVREEMNSRKDWGLFSPQAELHLQNMMGLQTWNSIRALDFLLSLEDVDPKRVAVTGASGGGTQTFILTAIDDRIKVAFPAVMVSTAMQGGCTCENATYLRIGAGNIDIAALAAPRPLGLTAADDWTSEIMTKGFPDLKKLYELLGHENRVHAEAFVHFEHNYNSVSRTVMYNWLNRHLKLGFEEPIIEQDYVPLSIEEMSVWDDRHPKPSGDQVGDAHERALVRWMTKDSQKRIEASIPNDERSLKEYRRIVGGGFDVILGRRLEDVGRIEYELCDKRREDDYLLMTALLTHTSKGEQLPTLYLYPKDHWNTEVVIWIHEAGKRGLFGSDGFPKPEVVKLLDAGYSVAGIDLLYQGEFSKNAELLEHARMVKNRDGSQPWHRASVYTFGYNRPLFAQRVHDILTLIKFVRTDKHGAQRIHLLGLGPVAGPLVAAARAQAEGAIDRAAIDIAGFRFAGLDRFDDPMFLPGAVKYHDIAGLLALSAPHDLWLAGAGGKEVRILEAVYAASGNSHGLTLYRGKGTASEAVDWLSK